MVGISSTQSTSTGSAVDTSKSSTASNALDMNAFLRMFTTQLQYQDPTNPLESYELAAQLAQFSSVEKLTDISSKMEAQQQVLSSLSNQQTVQMLGKQVIGTYDGIQVSNGSVSKSQYELPGQAADVTIKIYSDNGALVRTLSPGAQAAGKYDVSWDGKDNSGNAVPEGSYRVEVKPVASDGTAMDVNQYVTGTAYAFRVVGGVGYLVLDSETGLMLPGSMVSEVRNLA